MKEQHTHNTPQQNTTPAGYKHIIKYTGFFSIVQTLTILISVGRNKLTAILLGATGMGLSTLYLTITSFIHSTTNLGIAFSSIKEISQLYTNDITPQIQQKITTVRTWSIWTGLLGMILCITLSPLICLTAFGNTTHTTHLCILAPTVPLMAITAAELSILKAIRKLKRIALVTLAGALATILLTIPFYYLWGINGIVPSLLATTIAVTCIHLSQSATIIPWKVKLTSLTHLHQGKSLIHMGAPYTLATIANAGTATILALIITRLGTLQQTGLYNMAYNLVFVYATIPFAALESDYFPRLSNATNSITNMNLAANRQIRVCNLLISPILIILMTAMPLLVKTLYTNQFLPMTNMAVCASIHLFFKSMTLPVAYMALAKADGKTYLLMEILYDTFTATAVIIGYLTAQLTGVGIALALAGIFDWILIYTVYSKRYGFRHDKTCNKLIAGQFVCVTLALAAALQQQIPLKALAGTILTAASLLITYKTNAHEIQIKQLIKQVFHIGK